MTERKDTRKNKKAQGNPATGHAVRDDEPAKPRTPGINNTGDDAVAPGDPNQAAPSG